MSFNFLTPELLTITCNSMRKQISDQVSRAALSRWDNLLKEGCLAHYIQKHQKTVVQRPLLRKQH